MPSRKPAIVARLFERLREARRRRRDQRQLAGLSEGELRDLGVGRSQIPGLVRPSA